MELPINVSHKTKTSKETNSPQHKEGSITSKSHIQEEAGALQESVHFALVGIIQVAVHEYQKSCRSSKDYAFPPSLVVLPAQLEVNQARGDCCCHDDQQDERH